MARTHMQRDLAASDTRPMMSGWKSGWAQYATGNLINTISPDLVLYGGGVIEALGDVFLKKILAEVDRYCMPTIRSTVEIKTASLGDDSILYGDLAMIKGLH